MKKLKFIFLSLIIILILTDCLQALTIKIGTIAPQRSPWVTELRKLGVEWGKITNGLVDLKIYAGGIAGGEEDMVRKIRMGVLGGAVFTNIGIINIDPETYVISTPFFLNSEEELDYILDKMNPIFSKQIEDKGFKIIAWSKAGWVLFFTKKPIYYPDDLKKHKISITPGIPAMEQALKSSGFRLITTELKDLMMALQSGMVDAFYLSPLLAASGQYFALTPNMCPLKIAPIVGGFIVSKRIWDQIPDQYKEKMLEVTKKMAATLFEETVKLEKEAVDEMQKNGLKINPLPPDALEKWKAASDKGMNSLIGKAFSKEIYDKLVQYINELRNSHERKQE